MATLGPVIGTIGGGGSEIQSVPISSRTVSGNSTYHLLTTFNIPVGETWLVSVVLVQTAGHNNLAYPEELPAIAIGSKVGSRGYGSDNTWGNAATATGTTQVRILTNDSTSVTFSGTVYAVKM